MDNLTNEIINYGYDKSEYGRAKVLHGHTRGINVNGMKALEGP